MSGEERDQYFMRPMGGDDIPIIARWFEHLEDLAMFDRRLPLPLSIDAMESEWREALAKTEPRTSYWFAIDDAEDEVVGIVGLQSINHVHGDAVLPIYLAAPARRKGIGIRAGGLILDLAFDQLRLTRITSYFRSDNEASRRITEATGFREEGLLRKAWFADGRHFDIVVIGLLAEEWRAQRQDLAERLSRDTVVILGRTSWGARAWPELPLEELKAAAGG